MEKEAPLKVGVIGCGNITLNGHGPAIAGLQAVRAVGVADPIEARRDEALNLLDLPPEAGFESHVGLLEEAAPDYVVVTVPQSIRGEIIDDCADRGVHVLSEKPIATRPSEGKAFAERMRQAGLKFGVVHNYLFYPEHLEIRNALNRGEIGQVRHIVMNYMGVPDNPGHADYQPLWRHDYQHAGGGILMDMIHVLYLAEYFFGEPIRSVSAAVDNLSQPGGEVEDLALMRVAFSNGYASINLGWGRGPGGIEVTGTEGRIVCYYEEFATGPFTDLRELTIIGPGGAETRTPRSAPPSVETFAGIHDDFVSAIREGREPIAGPGSGMRALEAALGAYASGVTGQVIALPLDPKGPLHRLGLEGLSQLPAWDESPVIDKRLYGLGGIAKEVTT